MENAKKTNKLYYSAEELSNLLGISLGYSYKLIRKLNEELVKDGYIVISGKVSKLYFEKRWYGGEEGVALARKSGKKKMEVTE